MELSASFWKGRRVFVTGHTGFKGSWLSLWLSELGANVFGYALPPTGPRSLFETLRISDRVQSTLADVRDAQALRHALSEARPHLIIHMAAQALVRDSYARPVDTYDVNVMGTVRLLDAARELSELEATIVVTSDKCYENREWVWGYRENDALGGGDPYSSSKACAELVANAYRRSFGMKLATARAGNVIGGGDWSTDRLIPDLMRALYEKRSPEIRNPMHVRTWQHVLDPLHGYLMLAQALSDPCGNQSDLASGWNFGPAPSEARSVGAVTARVLDLWGAKAWDHRPDDSVREARTLRLDSTKAEVHLGWIPAWTVEDALSRVVEWHKSDYRHEDPIVITLRQLSEYQAVKRG